MKYPTLEKIYAPDGMPSKDKRPESSCRSINKSSIHLDKSSSGSLLVKNRNASQGKYNDVTASKHQQKQRQQQQQQAPSSANDTKFQLKKGVKINKGKYLIKSKIGSGSFGEIFRGIDLDRQREVAIKMEPVNTRNAQLKYESKVYELLHTSQTYVIGIPAVYWFGQEGNYNVMVMDLCGPSLEDMFNYCLRRFSLKTCLMLGIQMLHRIEYVHDKGIIHRDIKSDNYVFGLREKGHVLQMIDFGLCKRYFDRKTNLHIPFKDGKALIGTARYCSPNAHKGYEQSRRDDLVSIGHLLIYFLVGKLPWQGINATDPKTKTTLIGRKKIATKYEDLCKNCPDEFLQFMNYSSSLEFTARPDYNFLRSLFENKINAVWGTIDWNFDWFQKRGEEVAGEKSSVEHLQTTTPQTSH